MSEKAGWVFFIVILAAMLLMALDFEHREAKAYNQGYDYGYTQAKEEFYEEKCEYEESMWDNYCKLEEYYMNKLE